VTWPPALAATAVLLLSPVQTLAAEPAGAEIAAAVEEASATFGLPRAWIEAVIAAESGGDPRAVSPAGAMGLMQLMPGTWRELRAALELGPDPFAVRDNVMAGAAYLRWLLDRFGSPGFLAAYNAGPARLEAHLAGRAELPGETRAYVRRLAPLVSRDMAPDPGQSDGRRSALFPTVGSERAEPRTGESRPW
jgi:soluble lytic murein transglycosylase-like protein